MTDTNPFLIRSAVRTYSADGILDSAPLSLNYGSPDGYLSAAELTATKSRAISTFQVWLKNNQHKTARIIIQREHNRVNRLVGAIEDLIPAAQKAEQAGKPGVAYMDPSFYEIIERNNLGPAHIAMAVQANTDLDGEVTFEEADRFAEFAKMELWDINAYYPETIRAELFDALRPPPKASDTDRGDPLSRKLVNVKSPYGKSEDTIGRPARQSMRGLNFPGDRAAPEASARSALRHFSDPIFGRRDQTPDVRLIEEKQGLASSHSRFQQVKAGLPVYDAYITVHQGAEGQVQSIHSNFVQNIRGVSESVPEVNQERAIEAALQEAQLTSAAAPPIAELVWYPVNGSRVAQAWVVDFYSDKRSGDYHTVVDAATGAVILHEDRQVHRTATGRVFVPNPVQTKGTTSGLTDAADQPSAELRGQMVDVVLQGLDDDTDLLVGEFVDVASLNSPSKPDVDARSSDGTYNYDRNDPRFEQVVVYHAVDSIQRYFHQLGFDNDNGTRNGIRDFPTRANAHWYDADNSFYRPSTDAIHFGDGGVDDGEDADVIAHEYGHAVQHDQNSLFYGGETRAMGEGFGDYLAATMYFSSGDGTFQRDHAAAVAEWDATSYSGANPPNLRRTDENKHYPEDLVGEEHADGEIWSRVLWDIRGSLGGEDADRLILEHHFALPARATFADAARELLQADRNLYEGRNQEDLRSIFSDRGISVE